MQDKVMERFTISLDESLARLTSQEYARHQFNLIPVSLDVEEHDHGAHSPLHSHPHI